MPFGDLITTGADGRLLAVRRGAASAGRSSPVRLSFWLGFMVNELPFLAVYVLAASTALAFGQGDIANPVGWIGLGLAVLATAGLVVVVLRAMRTGGAVDDALIAAGLPARAPRRLPSGSSSAVRGAAPGNRANLQHRLRRRRARESARRVSVEVASGTGPTLVHLQAGRSASATRAARRGRSSTGSHAADGSASARTTGCARSSPIRSSM